MKGLIPVSFEFFSAARASRRSLDAAPVPQLDKIESVQEQADEILLADVFKRKDRLNERFAAIAEMVYITRADWIGGNCLPWGLLTEGRRQDYINEVRNLITKAKGEQ